ncbi:hypothetical protein [Rhodococcus sp. IEGM 1307]|uniref:hypothetical protein n=1 Tax=Rhodococcus sp. IEGM 1307 TaxID=3047091 RepID=UPI0024B6650B|nr:hypothetical protein [Rhodococcus sp. IEGM 1307]MDI9979237.1 hypothetical protein [Rhodococcus sp. IEGM 1307]
MLVGVGVATVAFVGWELRAKTRLIDPVDVQMGAFLAALGVSGAAGVALMVTLVDVSIIRQYIEQQRRPPRAPGRPKSMR